MGRTTTGDRAPGWQEGSWHPKGGGTPDQRVPACRGTGGSDEGTQQQFRRQGEASTRAISWNLLSHIGSPVSECPSSQCETSMITSVVIRRNFMTSSSPWTSAIFERPQVHRGLEVLRKVPVAGRALGRSGIKVGYLCLPRSNSTRTPTTCEHQLRKIDI